MSKTRKPKRLLSLLLCLAMVLGLLPAMSLTASAYTGSGTEADPYIVTDYDDLLDLMKSTPNNTTRYIKLGSDISYSASTNGTALNLSNALQSVDLDLNGYTVSRSGITTDTGVVELLVGSLTIRDSSSAGTGKMTSSVSGGSGQATVYVSSSGKLTIENGTFEVTNGTYPEAIWTQGGTTQINGGTFINTKAGGSGATFEQGDVTVDGGTFITNDDDPDAGFGLYVGSTANVILHSCTVIGGPRGIISRNGTKIPEGYFYYATTIDGRSAMVVMPNDGTSKDKPIFVSNFDQLKAIHSAPTDGTPFYIALNADEAYSTETFYIYGVEVNNGQNVILDLRGHTLHVRLGHDDMITVFGGGTLTINDSVGGGALITEGQSSKLLNVIRISGAGKLTVNGGSFQNRGYGRCMSVSGENAEVILNGGEFLPTRSPAEGTYNVELQYGSMTINYAHIYDSLYNARKAGNFTINGLLFQSFGEPGVIKQATGSSCVGSKYLEDHINPTSTVTVDGEEVTNLHVSSLEGYTIEITPVAKISSVKITDVTAPVIGETVNFTATATATGAEKTNVRWFDWDENRYLSEGDVFKEGHAYMIVVTMNAMEGYAFNTTNSTMTVTVNGKKGFLSRATQESVDCSYCFDTAYPAPVITTQPAYNLNIDEGEGFSLHVEAENATSYEWHYVNQVGTDYVLEKQILHYKEGTQNTDTLVMNYFDYNSRLGHIYCRVYGPGGYTDSDESYINVLPVEYDLWVNGVQVTSENKKNLAYNGYGWATYLPYKNELRLWDGLKINYTAGERVEFSDGGYLDNNYSGILYYTPAGATARELKVTVQNNVTVSGSIGIRALTSADAIGTGSIRVIGWNNSKDEDTLTINCSYPFRDGAVTIENCTVNITGCINISSSLTLKNADVTATAPSASSYAINATNYSNTITVMGDSNLTLMGKGGGKAANLYPEPEYRAQQVLYPAYTTSVFLDATSPTGANGANAWTDPTTEPNWNDYQYISIRTQNENTPVGMVQFKLDGVPTVGETAPSVSVVDAYADYVDSEATEYAWWLVEDGRVVSQLLDWSTLQPGRTYRVYAYAVASDGYSFAEYTVNRFKVYKEDGTVADTQYGTVDRNGGDYANFYAEFTMPGEATGVTVSGTATSLGADTDDVIIQLIESGASEAAYETIVHGNSASYSIAGVAPGTYTMKVMKTKHAPREYTVIVGTSDVTQNAEIWLYGDVTADGLVNSTDATQINRYFSGKTSVFGSKDSDTESYRLIVANVYSKDNTINATDATQIKRHFSGKSSVFTDFA